jgi:hypothetical protein
LPWSIWAMIEKLRMLARSMWAMLFCWAVGLG